MDQRGPGGEPMRGRRSWLFVPGDSERKLAKGRPRARTC